MGGKSRIKKKNNIEYRIEQNIDTQEFFPVQNEHLETESVAQYSVREFAPAN